MDTIRSFSKVISFVPTITATPYSAGDTVGTVNAITGATFPDGPYTGSGSGDVRGVSTIGTISVIDLAKQNVALDLFFFNQSPTVSADNAAFNMDDANAAHYIGHVTIATTDYANCTDTSFVCLKAVGLIVSPIDDTIYCVVVARGAPTYAAGALTIKVGVYQE